MYRGLLVISIVIPAVLLYTVNFNSSNHEFLRQRFPGRVDAMLLVLNVATLAFWLFVFHQYILGVLRPHRTGDRILQSELAHERRRAQRGRPRTVFYVGVACTVVFLTLLLFMRYL